MSRSATQEWLSENGTVTYPLHEDADLSFAHANSGASIQLPTDLLVDAVFTVPIELVEDVVLSKISTAISGGTINVSFELTNPDGGAILSVATLSAALFGGPSTYDLEIADVLPGYDLTIPVFIGRLVVSQKGLNSLAAFPTGSYVPTSAPLFEHSVVKDNPLAKVKSLGDPFFPLTGDVQVCEGYNIEITRVPEENGFRIDAILGGGLGTFCGTACDDPSICNSAISNINGVYADLTSYLHMIGQGAVEIRPDSEYEHGLVISTLIDSAELCERTGIVGTPGPQGPAGARGEQGDPVDPDVWLCPCETCEVCDTCEENDGSQQCVACEVCDVCENEPPGCAVACEVCDTCNVAMDGPPPPPWPSAGAGGQFPYNPQPDGVIHVAGQPVDMSGGQGILLPGCNPPLAGDTGSALPNLEDMEVACHCTQVAFATVESVEGSTVTFTYTDTAVSQLLDENDEDSDSYASGTQVNQTARTDSTNVDNPEAFAPGDTILVQTFSDGTISLFVLS